MDPILAARLETADYHARAMLTVERIKFARNNVKRGRNDLALQELESAQKGLEELIARHEAVMKRRHDEAYASMNMILDEARRTA